MLRPARFALAASLTLLAAAPPDATAQSRRLTLPDVAASNVYSGAFFSGGRFAPDGAVVRYVETRDDGTTDLASLDLESGARAVFLSGADLTAADVNRRIGIEDYAESADGQRLLLYTDSRPCGARTRRDSTTSTTARAAASARRHARCRHAALRQALARRPKVGFVRGRNLYVRDVETGAERAITTDGADGGLIHGTTDWVYEEEFGLRDAWQWSPDGSRIAFLTLDESAEQTFTMQDLRTFYPTSTTFRYPKAGTPNAEIQLGIADVATGAVRYFDTDTWREGGNATEYLPRFGWVPAASGMAPTVWMFRMNRDQTTLDLLYGDAQTMNVRTVLTERASAWIETETGFSDLVGGTLTYLADGRHFVWISERDGHRHLYLYRTADGALVRQLTSGRYDVTGFLGADEPRGLVYFNAALPSPTERNVMRQRVSFADADTPAPQTQRQTRGRTRGRAPQIATVGVSQAPERITTAPGWHDAELSRDRRFLIVTHSTLTQPPVVTLRRVDGTVVRTLEANADLIARLADTRLPVGPLHDRPRRRRRHAQRVGDDADQASTRPRSTPS